jgi:hypothetical protein
MRYTEAEEHAAARDATALIRAMLDGDDDRYQLILDTAGDHGRRGIAEALAFLAHGTMLRWRALAAIPGLPPDAHAILAMDVTELRTIDGLTEAAIAQLDMLQLDLAAEG